MLKVTAPYVRETPVLDEGKAIVVKIEPPGYSIGFRLRHSKQTYHLNVLDAWKAARAMPERVHTKANSPAKTLSVREEILKVLGTQKRLHIAKIMQGLKEHHVPADRRMAGEILDMLKEMGKVQQEGLEYSLKK